MRRQALARGRKTGPAESCAAGTGLSMILVIQAYSGRIQRGPDYATITDKEEANTTNAIACWTTLPRPDRSAAPKGLRISPRRKHFCTEREGGAVHIARYDLSPHRHPGVFRVLYRTTEQRSNQSPFESATALDLASAV